ncbi:hypothetical protein J3R83DRAFT_1603 [Lanmaoa asiatica]|nr:hypothetical protein J3R83DRAFT_1603 [Lanmaoa asiatica]
MCDNICSAYTQRHSGVRNPNKKLKAIEELKEKAKWGERLEATQLKKMEGEADIRREIASRRVIVVRFL